MSESMFIPPAIKSGKRWFYSPETRQRVLDDLALSTIPIWEFAEQRRMDPKVIYHWRAHAKRDPSHRKPKAPKPDFWETAKTLDTTGNIIETLPTVITQAPMPAPAMAYDLSESETQAFCASAEVIADKLEALNGFRPTFHQVLMYLLKKEKES